MTGSNRRHPACKAGALPAELIAQGLTTISIHKNTHCVKVFLRFSTYKSINQHLVPKSPKSRILPVYQRGLCLPTSTTAAIIFGYIIRLKLLLIR